MSRLADRVRELGAGDQYRKGELAVAFIDDGRALAAVEALELGFSIAEGYEWAECQDADQRAFAAAARAVLRSWEQALGIAEEQSDGVPDR